MSLAQAPGYVQLNQYRLLEPIGQVSGSWRSRSRKRMVAETEEGEEVAVEAKVDAAAHLTGERKRGRGVRSIRNGSGSVSESWRERGSNSGSESGNGSGKTN